MGFREFLSKLFFSSNKKERAETEKQFEFLVNDYGLKHSYQDFNNCYGGYWYVRTHSYYNENGCFTIYNLPQRGELAFYRSKEFSDVLERLCERKIDVAYTGQEFLDKAEGNFPLNCGRDAILKTLAEVVKKQIEKDGEFFGIKVK
jgi:hypothetical protein